MDDIFNLFPVPWQAKLLLDLPKIASDKGLYVALDCDLSALLLQFHIVKLSHLTFDENCSVST